jgi:hypothetical protein
MPPDPETRRGEPFAPARPGCGGHSLTGQGGCNSPARYAGLAFFEHSGRAWLAFACPEHRHQLIAARELTERDRAELERRREHLRAVRDDHVPHVPVQPLAEGLAARELVERAQRWAEREKGERDADPS